MKLLQKKIIENRYMLPILFFIFNFVVKIIYLSHSDIAGDEPFTIFYAQVDWTTFSEMLQNENNPPLYFVLLHYWIEIFGISAFSVRFLPLIFSSFTAVILFQFGRKFINVKTGVIATLLFSLSNYHMLFAHETRVYALFTLLTTLSFFAFLSLWKEPKNKKYLLLLVLWNSLLIYSHFFGFIVLFLQGISVLFIKEMRTTLFKKYILSTLLTFIAFVPYLALFLSRFTSSSGGTWVGKPNFSSLYENIRKFSNEPVVAVLFLAILVSGAISYFIKRKGTSLNTGQKVIILWFLIPYFLMFIASNWMPMFLDRYLVYISIAFYLCVAIAINSFSTKKYIHFGLSLLSVGLMAITFQPKSGNPLKKQELVELIKEEESDSTITIICPNWADKGFTYYYNQNYFSDYKNLRKNLNNKKVYPIQTVLELNKIDFSECDKVIYLDGWSKLVDPNGEIFNSLNTQFNLTEKNEDYKGFIYYVFEK